MNTVEKRQCPECKYSFIVKEPFQVFCSEKCYLNYYCLTQYPGKGDTCICYNCNKIFVKKFALEIFCSNNCRNSYNDYIHLHKDQKMVSCRNCDNSFLQISFRQKFCNDGCRDSYNNNKAEEKSFTDKTCVYCAKPFKKTKINQKCCSTECEFKHNKKPNGKKQFKNCLNCGRLFITQNCERNFCSNCKNNFSYTETKIKGERRICPECNTIFIRKGSFQIFCSENCHYKNIKKTTSVQPLIIKTCLQCKKTFKTRFEKSEYCSMKCKKLHNNRIILKDHFIGQKTIDKEVIVDLDFDLDIKPDY